MYDGSDWIPGSFLPLSAGSGNQLTGTLYSQNIIPATNYSESGSTRNGNDIGGISNNTIYWYKDIYVKRIYLKRSTPNSSGVYFEFDEGSDMVYLHGAGFDTDV